MSNLTEEDCACCGVEVLHQDGTAWTHRCVQRYRCRCGAAVALDTIGKIEDHNDEDGRMRCGWAMIRPDSANAEPIES